MNFRPATEDEIAKPAARTKYAPLLEALLKGPQIVEIPEVPNPRNLLTSAGAQRKLKLSIRKIDATHFLVSIKK